jgi:hypothetical protein
MDPATAVAEFMRENEIVELGDFRLEVARHMPMMPKLKVPADAVAATSPPPQMLCTCRSVTPTILGGARNAPLAYWVPQFSCDCLMAIRKDRKRCDNRTMYRLARSRFLGSP